jgi:hypothetical protein
MYCKYPEGSEYEYIDWTIQQQYFLEQETLLHPIEDEYWNAYTSGDRTLANELWEKAQQLRQELCERFRRKEDILDWLNLDTQLRAEGKTYPDVYEAVEEDDR